MTTVRRGVWASLPIVVRATLAGLGLGLVAANVWLVLLAKLDIVMAAPAEVMFLGVFLWWASGGGPPRSWKASRVQSFRRTSLTRGQWLWASIAAASFAVTVHAAMVVLYRLVPFPAAAFHAGYDLSFIASPQLRWLAILVSAASAGICEETGFRGYLQRPIEKRHGALAAICISSLLFTVIHLPKGWSTISVVPIVLGAGLLLGMLAWVSGSLVPGMIAHTLMDAGLFAYWWVQIAGPFPQRPVGDVGLDHSFYIESVALVSALTMTLTAILMLQKIGRERREQVR
ncbi:MAG TPA: type II CAAX endopeptidase family protein [Vicinamibacteria bacterium]|nr:type II CAAX endopeptidase family protein [Vicinamibacteria bacterium]